MSRSSSSSSTRSEPHYITEIATTGGGGANLSSAFGGNSQNQQSLTVLNTNNVTPNSTRRILGGEEFQRLFDSTIKHSMAKAQQETIRKYASPDVKHHDSTIPMTRAKNPPMEPSRVNQISKIYSMKSSKARSKVNTAIAVAQNAPAVRTRPLKMDESDGYRLYDELVQTKETLQATMDKYTKAKAENQKLTEKLNKVNHEKVEILQGRRNFDTASAHLLNETTKCSLLQQKIDILERTIDEKDTMIEQIRCATRVNVHREMNIQIETYVTEINRLKHNLQAMAESERVKRHKEEMAIAMSIVDSRERELDDMRKCLRGINVVTGGTPAPQVNVTSNVVPTSHPTSPTSKATAEPKKDTTNNTSTTIETSALLTAAHDRAHLLEKEIEHLKGRLSEAGPVQEQITRAEAENASLARKIHELTKVMETERINHNESITALQERLEKNHATMMKETTQLHNDLVTSLKNENSSLQRKVSEYEAQLRQEQATHRSELEAAAIRAEKEKQRLIETMQSHQEKSSKESTDVMIERQDVLLREKERLTQEMKILAADKQQLEDELSKYRRELLQPKPMMSIAAVQTEGGVVVGDVHSSSGSPQLIVPPVSSGGGPGIGDVIGRGGRYKPENDTMSEITVVKGLHGKGGDGGDSVIRGDYDQDTFDDD
eukprot:PhF_6_TR37586/c0_g1_i1/m.55767